MGNACLDIPDVAVDMEDIQADILDGMELCVVAWAVDILNGMGLHEVALVVDTPGGGGWLKAVWATDIPGVGCCEVMWVADTLGPGVEGHHEGAGRSSCVKGNTPSPLPLQLIAEQLHNRADSYFCSTKMFSVF